MQVHGLPSIRHPHGIEVNRKADKYVFYHTFLNKSECPLGISCIHNICISSMHLVTRVKEVFNPKTIKMSLQTLLQKLIGKRNIERDSVSKRRSTALILNGPEDMQMIKYPRYQKVEIPFHSKTLVIPDAASCYYAYQEIFDREIYQFPSANRRPLIIDCGANVGLSVLYFKSLYPECTIKAIEADPSIFTYLKRNIETFGYNDVDMVEKAVASIEGEIMFAPEGADAGRMIQKFDETQYGLRVSSVALDDLIDREVDFLKIDIEGVETDVILNSKNLYLVKNLFVEYHSFSKSHQQLHNLLEKISEEGFRYYITAPYCPPKPFMSQKGYLGMDLQLNISCIRNV
jgi:FkbM family methyltransferase